MTSVEHPQTEFPLLRDLPQAFIVPIEMVRACKTGGEALDLAIRASGLAQKEVYMACDIDPGTFSRILSNKATFPDDKLRSLHATVKNRIFDEWRAFQVGSTLVVIQSEAERMLEEKQRQLDEAMARIKIVEDILKDRR